MKITCPSCDTSYNIGATSVGPEGRSVRCSRCSEEWYIDSDGNSIAAPDEDTPKEDTPSNEDEWAAAFESSENDDIDDDAPVKSENAWKAEIGLEGDDDSAPGLNFPLFGGETPASKSDDQDELPFGVKERPRKRKRKNTPYNTRFNISPEMRAALGLGLFLFSVVLSVGVILMREPIVRAAPNMAGLYSVVGLNVNLRGLEFNDLRTFQEYEKGGVVLIVEGRITNTRERSTHVPALFLALRSSDAQEVYTWTVEPRVRRIPAGQYLRFSTRVASPPEIATDVHVSFIDRNNNPAKL